MKDKPTFTFAATIVCGILAVLAMVFGPWQWWQLSIIAVVNAIILLTEL